MDRTPLEKDSNPLKPHSFGQAITPLAEASAQGEGGPQLRPGRNASGHHSEHRNFKNHAVCSRQGGMHKQVCARPRSSNALLQGTSTSELTLHLQVDF